MDYYAMNSVLLLIIGFCHLFFTTEALIVNPTLVPDNGALCLSGIRAAYYFSPGSDEGLDNWLVYLPGGGWCETSEACLQYIEDRNISNPAAPEQFNSILSNDCLQNPDFYNWNKVMIRYCDGSSYTGDSETVYNGTTLYFRGARIYGAVMDEMIKKGMGFGKKALLVGESAGGVAAMLYCDKFRDMFSSSAHIKCLSDAGHFFPARNHNGGNGSGFVSIFEGLVTLHRSANMLPKSCTSRLCPALCFFAQNVQDDINTPIFFIMSGFDLVEISTTTGDFRSYGSCVNGKNCTSDQIKVMQDLRQELLDVMPKKSNCSSTGFLIVSNYGHRHVTYPTWYLPTVGTNETMAALFGDWYQDKKVVQVTDDCDNPYGCT